MRKSKRQPKRKKTKRQEGLRERITLPKEIKSKVPNLVLCHELNVEAKPKLSKFRPGTKKRKQAKRLREWMKFLEDDRDFDFCYILRVLCYKLRRTRECIMENNVIAAAPQVAAEIREVEVLLQRVIDDEYFENLTRPLEEQYGEYKMDIGPKGVLHCHHEKETSRNMKKIMRLRKKAMRMAEQNMVDDLRKAFSIMSEKIWGWWD